MKTPETPYKPATVKLKFAKNPIITSANISVLGDSIGTNGSLQIVQKSSDLIAPGNYMDIQPVSGNTIELIFTTAAKYQQSLEEWGIGTGAKTLIAPESFAWLVHPDKMLKLWDKNWNFSVDNKKVVWLFDQSWVRSIYQNTGNETYKIVGNHAAKILDLYEVQVDGSALADFHYLMEAAFFDGKPSVR
jgi:hypothetical protein